MGILERTVAEIGVLVAEQVAFVVHHACVVAFEMDVKIHESGHAELAGHVHDPVLGGGFIDAVIADHFNGILVDDDGLVFAYACGFRIEEVEVP
ncbi:MAG: hypothetical protein D6732_11875 [Methanobacteriota archaeon]|nr:MAG: hypothetical protein D6732_11875 [Euryarchaeota archaeon]